MKKFDMSLDKSNKELKVKAWGMYGIEDANSFVKDFIKTTFSIKASEFILCFDAAELKVFTGEVVPVMEKCFEIYKDFGFKKVLMEAGSNAILKMQLKRVGKNAGLAVEVV